MKVSKSITLPDGTVDWGIKEKDYIPEATRLLSTKVEDPLARREQFAVDQRKSRKKGLLAQRRGLFGNKTPIERSVSPMFGAGEAGGLEDGLPHGHGSGAGA